MTISCSLSRLPPGHYSEQSVKRLPRRKAGSITKNKGIQIHYFSTPDNHPLSKISLKPLTSFLVSLPSMKLNLLWHIECVQGDEGWTRESGQRRICQNLHVLLLQNPKITLFLWFTVLFAFGIYSFKTLELQSGISEGRRGEGMGCSLQNTIYIYILNLSGHLSYMHSCDFTPRIHIILQMRNRCCNLWLFVWSVQYNICKFW